MSRQIPAPIRAYVGLAATILDEARKLPEALPGLPVRAVGLAMQTALKVQQQWAGLVARGDEALTGLRGEAEPGLATFDDDEDFDAPPAPSARASAFDRAAADVPDHDDLAVEDTAAALDETDAVTGSAPLVDDEVSGLAAVPDPTEVAETLQDITDQVAALGEDAVAEDAEAVLTPEDALEAALLESDAAGDTAAETREPTGVEEDTAGAEVTEVDVLSPDGEVETVEATVTDEAVAAPETLADLAPAEPGTAPVTEADADGAAQDVAEGGTPVAAVGPAPEEAPEQATEQAGGAAPVAGYDDWTIAQLRGRLRGYQLSTVADLLAYEESTRARDPFLRMLRNRLEKLERQAVEASPLAPRGM